MNDSNNMFEELVKRFYLKYDKLQIDGFHGISSNNNNRQYRSVSPTKRNANLFNV
jgi:hypothetical protein